MPDEQRLLDSWMKEKEEHKQLFERLRKDTRFAEEYGYFVRWIRLGLGRLSV